MASRTPATLHHIPSEPLLYAIAGCSEHSGRYVAENIMVDAPNEQTSRWSGAGQTVSVKQWISLRLETTSVVKSITFGKFHKPHPCNMKEFKIFVGMVEDNMIEVLHGGLKNDSIPETFALKHVNAAGVYIPCRFLKITPLSAHGQSFHTSIWFVSVSGVIDHDVVAEVQNTYDEYRENAVLRLILKHLRQRRFLTPYQSLLSRVDVQLEHPLISSLYDHLVLQGAFSSAEEVLQSVAQAGLFDVYINSCPAKTSWSRITGTNADGDVPSRRGGHAMCIDDENGLIYLLGGWDGHKNLDDFWVYDIHQDRWSVVSHNTSQEKNGPGRRSCHKMAFDRKMGCIYLLGRLDEGEEVKPEGASRNGDEAGRVEGSSGSSFCSEFYRYHTRGLDSGTWDLLCIDTSSSGGPPLLFDHQMVMDADNQILYVFGGRVVDADMSSHKYSGMYSYNVRTSKWMMLQPADNIAATPHQVCIPSRFGHSMVLEPNSRTLFIFAGQRDNGQRESKYLSDMYAYDIDADTATEVFSNYTPFGGPEHSFTQRAVLDPDLREIYVFCGLTRPPLGSQLTLECKSLSWLYRYNPANPAAKGQWSSIQPSEVVHSHHSTSVGLAENNPKPRYAHQVVYDRRSRVVYMHGGNAGNHDNGDEDAAEDAEDRELRLDDFWRMELQRPPRKDIIRNAVFRLRRQQFREMCEDGPLVKALTFLQTEVSAVVDHKNTEEQNLFRSLLSHLVSQSPVLSPRLIPPPKLPEAGHDVRRDGDDDVEPPRKRSRPNTPEDLDHNLSDESGSGAPSVALPNSSGDPASLPHPLISYQEDPNEAKFGSGMELRHKVSASRFQQRTEVFEDLLTLINQEAKQPEGDLVDFIDRDVDP
ncbi:hypothetical protein JAAARDRAFT_208578 [Jaapia argillacea MUCL 33604]|uniref:Muskelin N-terminal domain-containing protein n=1 Tax=Jaapia argillacea MUCL 33604 TaxID=933084 RepID=A0A067PWZ0_9AGAM|nr:hypothetical protein JAAARDRAFT_208578 [Jaapia argillacea MUCL 33604]